MEVTSRSEPIHSIKRRLRVSFFSHVGDMYRMDQFVDLWNRCCGLVRMLESYPDLIEDKGRAPILQ